MVPVLGTSPRFRDPGGPGGGGPSNLFRGDYAGQLVPLHMDSDGCSGAIQVLQMKATAGTLPSDPFLLRTSIEKWIGKAIDGAFKENRGISYALKVRNAAHFQKLLKMDQLADGTRIQIVEHPTLNKRECVVSNHDCVDLSDDYLLEQLSGQGVRGIRRIKKKNSEGKLMNSPTIILTISGTVIPDHIDFGWSRCKTRNYYPAPMLCYKCWEYGHTKKRCLQVHQTCGTCSQVHEDGRTNTASGMADNMGVEASRPLTCNNQQFCKLCNSTDHPVSSRKCPIYMKEVEIQHIRIDKGYTYPQARREFESLQENNRNRGSFAGVAALSKDKEISDLSETVRRLIDDSRKKDERIAELERSLKGRSVGQRMDQVQQHGTIEDLITKVDQLTKSVIDLQATIKKKDLEIEYLRKIYVNPTETQSSFTTPFDIHIPETQDVPTNSTPQTDTLNLTPDTKTTPQYQEWTSQSGKSRKKNKKNRLKKDFDPAMEISSDDSTESNRSIASIQTTLSKRNHSDGDPGSDSSKPSKPKRSDHGDQGIDDLA